MKFSNQYFTIDVSFLADSVAMVMKVDEEFYHTRLFNNVVPFLNKHVPDVLCTKCFNPHNLSFKEEVINTEFGHLFEHILITILCEEVIKAGGKTAKYRASTAWDWSVSPRGTFDITIDAAVDPLLFAVALNKTTAFATKMCDQHAKTKTAVAPIMPLLPSSPVSVAY